MSTLLYDLRIYPVGVVENVREAADKRKRRVELEEEYVAEQRAARVQRDGNLLDDFGWQAAFLRIGGQLRVDGAHELALLVDLQCDEATKYFSIFQCA